MPVYDYLCNNSECGYCFELVLMTGKNKKTTKCPKCGKRAKKIPSVNARMRANWSTWDAMG
jgi:putative FmdB family regulatory protein